MVARLCRLYCIQMKRDSGKGIRLRHQTINCAGDNNPSTQIVLSVSI